MKKKIVRIGAYIVMTVTALALMGCPGTESPGQSGEKQILSFVIALGGENKPGTIDETDHTISFTLPAGTVVTALAPLITLSDKAVVVPASGVERDFTDPVTYTVTAENGSEQVYTVTVVVMGSPAEEDKNGEDKPAQDETDKGGESETPQDEDQDVIVFKNANGDPLTAHTFPQMEPGYSSISWLLVEVTNTGAGAVGPFALVLEGTGAESFELSAASIASIAAGGTYRITVRPKTGLGENTYTATVKISGEGISESFTVDFIVETIPDYRIAHNVSQGAHTFSVASPGYGAQTPLSVTVTNNGNRPTGDLAVALEGTDAGSFELSAGSLSGIAKEGSANFTVQPKTGLAKGNYGATVRVSGDNGLSAVFTVSFAVDDSGNAGLTLTLPDFSDPGSDLLDQDTWTIYQTGTPDAVTINLTGIQPGDAIVWRQDLTVKGNSSTITVKASDYDPGIYHWSVETIRGGAYLSREFALVVAESDED
jgi:hypothetical protein